MNIVEKGKKANKTDGGVDIKSCAPVIETVSYHFSKIMGEKKKVAMTGRKEKWKCPFIRKSRMIS